MHGHVRLLDDTKAQLGDNAHPYDNELMLDVRSRSFRGFTEGGKQIPFPIGLWRRIRNVKPDVLITEGFFQWTPIVQLYGLLFRVPVFMGYERTLWTERNNSRLKTWIRRMQDKAIRGYLVNGSETRKYLESIGVHPNKIHVGGMSADSTGLRSAISSMTQEEKKSFKARFLQGEKGLVYLFSGQMIERKGIVPLLEAWMEYVKEHPSDSLVVVGGGELLDTCKNRFGNEPSIYLEGRVDYAEVYKYYAISDVFVLPTIEDNWSLVVPEAMACGLPVTTSIYNGCHPELIREGKNGVTFDTFKRESIVRALDYFHHQDLKAMGMWSVELEKEFETGACARRVYEALISNR